jgi:hypothetical protein
MGPNQPPHAAPNSQFLKKEGTWGPNQPPHPCRAVLGSFCLQTLTGHNFCIQTPFSMCDLSNCPESKVISEILLKVLEKYPKSLIIIKKVREG